MHAADAVVLRLLPNRIGEPIALYRVGSSMVDSDIDYAVLATRPLEAIARFGLQEDAPARYAASEARRLRHA